MKIGALFEVVPSEIDKNLMCQNLVTSTYEEVKTYVIKQVDIRKETWFGDRVGHGGAGTMEVDKCHGQHQENEWPEDDENKEEEGDGDLNAFKGKGEGEDNFQVCAIIVGNMATRSLNVASRMQR